MKIGQLRHCLLFQRKNEPPIDQDSAGSVRENWITAFETWGAFEMVGSREFREEWKRNETATARFRIRYRSGIRADTHRVLFTLDPCASPPVHQAFNIFPPIPDSRRRELLIEAVEAF